MRSAAFCDVNIATSWEANLTLKLSYRDAATKLVYNRHQGPLYVQKPFYPEGNPEDKSCAHIYLLHPPGGIVSGDDLSIKIYLEKLSHSLITTPGAARLYKARPDQMVQRQNAELHVGEGALLEWFPMETILYNQTHAELNTTIKLHETGKCMAWELSCFGLPASNELFSEGKFHQRYRIERGNTPIFIDQLHCELEPSQNNAWLKSMPCMQSKTVSGFFVSGPFQLTKKEKQSITENLKDVLRNSQLYNHLQNTIAITWLDEICVIRYLGNSAYTARQGFTLLWHSLRPLLINKKACEPRIWLT